MAKMDRDRPLTGLARMGWVWLGRLFPRQQRCSSHHLPEPLVRYAVHGAPGPLRDRRRPRILLPIVLSGVCCGLGWAMASPAISGSFGDAEVVGQ
jgi:hypothetical protein